jgi:ATP synthase protein I
MARPIDNMGAGIARPPLARLYAALLGVLLLISAGFLWVDITTAYSVLLGGLISVGPSYYFARQAFRFRGARFARQIAQAFYVGETGKFVLTASAFAAVFALVKPLVAAAVLLAFLGMTLCHWVIMAYIGARSGARQQQ